MKALYLILSITIVFSNQEKNQNPPQKHFNYISGQLKSITKNPEYSIREYLSNNKFQSGYTNEIDFKLKTINVDKNNTTHLIFQQYYLNIPVFGKTIRAHINKNNQLSSISSNIVQFDIPVQPTFPIKEAINKIKLIKKPDRRSYIKYNQLYIYLNENKPHLIYSLEYVDFENPYNYFIDAHSGEIILEFPLSFQDGPTTGSGINLLNQTIEELQIYEGNSYTPIGNQSTPYLICEEYCWDYGDCDGENYNDCVIAPQQGNCTNGFLTDCNGDCFSEWYMQFPGVGNGFCNDPWIEFSDSTITTGNYNLVDESTSELGTIYTLNSYGGFYENISLVNSEVSIFNNNDNSLSHHSGVSAHDYQRKTLDYFWNYHNYAGIDGNGKRTISVVNYFSNSSISQNNAFYNASLDILTYGYGSASYRPFCAGLDVVTHEFSHGYTAHTSGLIYRNQAGALNESMSDVFGYLVEAVYQNGGDWLQAEDVHVNGAGRSFIHPPQYGQPDHRDHNYFVQYNSNPQWNNDFGGVHTNSGITNKLLYLTIQGDIHYNIAVPPFEEDIVQSRIIAGNIWFTWNTYYLDIEDDFQISKDKMLQVVQDIYPGRLDYLQTIINGWASLGWGTEIVSGDFNEDLIVNIQDVIILINIILGNFIPNEHQQLFGDINQDGLLNIQDILEIVVIIMN